MKKISVQTMALGLCLLLSQHNVNATNVRQIDKAETMSIIQNKIINPGTHLRYAYSDGSQYDVQLRTDGTLRWEALEGASRGQSAVENNYKIFALRDGIGMVTWLESSGYSITVIVDALNRKVFSVAAYEKEHYPLDGRLLELDDLH